ncbi:unnamed protein product [Porites evermanni]|uniref:Uncharacterized protein n=1 Tax=Porites evermanni TaxID=104178 RepID=A0ABN8QY52_9CNID|nr:unnamed protein product [Porites evermanni]
MDTNSDSGSSPTNQPVVPFALGQGSNAANQAIRQQNDHQANQARYGLPNMIAASSHAQPQKNDEEKAKEELAARGLKILNVNEIGCEEKPITDLRWIQAVTCTRLDIQSRGNSRSQ